MKKVTGILAAIALTAAIFTGCQAKKVSIDVNSLANDLKSKVKSVVVTKGVTRNTDKNTYDN